MATEAKIVVSAQDQTSSVFNKISANLTGLNSVAGRLANTAAGFGLGVAGIVAMAKSTIDGIDALNDLSDATGSSVENLSALEDIPCFMKPVIGTTMQ